MWVLHGVPQPKFLHIFWKGNCQNMDSREPEMILKVGEEHTGELDRFHSYGLQKALRTLEMRLGVKT